MYFGGILLSQFIALITPQETVDTLHDHTVLLWTAICGVLVQISVQVTNYRRAKNERVKEEEKTKARVEAEAALVRDQLHRYVLDLKKEIGACSEATKQAVDGGNHINDKLEAVNEKFNTLSEAISENQGQIAENQKNLISLKTRHVEMTRGVEEVVRDTRNKVEEIGQEIKGKISNLDKILPKLGGK